MAESDRSFDGLICFGGGDWWYHNRGHYDVQMIRQLGRHVPVVYVNSIGVRIPSPNEGWMFVRRILRKLRSWASGFRRLDPDFAVLSPVAIPGRAGMRFSRKLLGIQVARAARRMGIRRPIIWVECPSGIEVVEQLDPVGLVYQRTDRWEDFPGADSALIRDYDRRLKERADATLYASELLYREECGECGSARYLDHGVHFLRFERAGSGLVPEPDDVANLPQPRVGFVGSIDDHTFDASLFLDVARRLGDVAFVLVGGCSLPESWCSLPNVHLLGQRPYEEVPQYMAACGALIMPWKQNRWIEACNPVKLKEYLAVGRAVVSTPFAELRRYEGYVRVARDAGEFARELQTALACPPDPEQLRARVRDESWESRAETLLGFLAEAGLRRAGEFDSPREARRNGALRR